MDLTGEKFIEENRELVELLIKTANRFIAAGDSDRMLDLSRLLYVMMMQIAIYLRDFPPGPQPIDAEAFILSKLQ